MTPTEDTATFFPFPNRIPSRRPMPVDFKLTPTIDLKSLVTPPIPDTVAPGDLITSSHENTVTTALSDLWLNDQWLASQLSAAGAVQSVFGRVGAITAQAGDYAAFYPSATTRVIAGTGMSGGGPISADVTLNVALTPAIITAAGGVAATTQVIAGAGMTGGGALSGNVTLNANMLSVFGRSGTVTAQASDYSAFYVPVARQVLAGAGMTGGGPLSADVTLNAAVLSVFGRTGAVALTAADLTAAGILGVFNNGSLIGTRPGLNLIQGANVTLTFADDGPNNRVNVTIAATTGGGGAVASVFGRTGAVVAQAGDYNVAMITSACPDPTTFKGDLIARSTSAIVRVGVGTDGQVLTADSTQTSGMKWATPATGGGAQTPWTSDIDAANHKLFGASSVGLTRVYSETPSSLYQNNGNGFLLLQSHNGTTQETPVQLAVPDNTGAIAFYTSASVTPPTAPTFTERMRISNAGNVGISNDLTVAPYGGTDKYLVVGGPTTLGSSSQFGRMFIANNQSNGAGGIIGGLSWSNYAIAAANKWVAAINAFCDGSIDSGGLDLYTWTTGTPASKMRITSTGRVGIGTLSPGYLLDVAGDCNLSSGSLYRINGAQLAAANIVNAVDSSQSYANPAWISSLAYGKITGAPAAGGIATKTDYTGSRNTAQTFFNSSGHAIFVSVSMFLNPNIDATAKSDTGSSPGTIVGYVNNGGTNNSVLILCFWVLNGNYYTIASTGSVNRWIEWS